MWDQVAGRGVHLHGCTLVLTPVLVLVSVKLDRSLNILCGYWCLVYQVLTTQRRSSLFLGGMVFNSTDREYLKLMMRMDCLFVSEESSTTSKEPEQLAFSEDEETLVIRMYNLVGERLVVSLFLCVKNSSGWTWIHD